MVEHSDTRFVIVGVDGSDRSTDALRWALRQARHTGAAVRVILCWEEPWSILLAPTHTEEYYQDKAIEALERILAQTAADAEGINVESLVVHKPAGIELARASEGADLLVLGCHSRVDRHGLHLGSVASYCAHHASCPVLIYREPIPTQ
jgi:nucleotide-binding universal stress UspA family protein